MAPNALALKEGTQTATQTDSQAIIVPSKLQIALAIAILKTKPDGVTVRDHILCLRSHLKRGPQRFTEEEEHRHLDSVTYWRERYERAETKCHELEHRNAQLGRANDALQIHKAPVGLQGSAKRKGEAYKQNRSSKRLRGAPEVPENSVMGTQGTFAGDLDVLDTGVTLTQTLYTGHKLYKQHEADPKAICFNLIESSRAIGSVISTIARNYDQLAQGRSSTSLEKDKSELSYAIRASARAFTSLLVGLGKISSNGCDRQLPNLVIYECVRMFKTILDSISESARLSVANLSASQARGKGSRSNAPSSTKESNPPRTLAQFLNALISYLDKSDPNHREIFEGLLFILLERVGKRLFYCTFGRDRSATIEGDIVLPLAHNHPTIIATQETEALAVRLEIRSLVIILERAIALAPYHINSRPTSSSSVSKAKKTPGIARSLTFKTLPSASKAPLSSTAKDRLQRTLINCMFGQEDHDEFSDVLRMPARLGGLPSLAKVEDKDVNDWFQGEVWRLVGWDLLGREGDW
ncbi:hypothetical protein K505DRAFT_294774 [Melanomma pulvis-pyrius CBS 109.77]|uniref:Uncharacterized protein n=1 Tax=Melanomma pulvis-pyrius CBS 109.77 TaxID=1314802 RepID=A0A6A6XTG4_9PLEO|nr:hypothetical protein K505DRAFT_294774 [Melanomma pulvis-pyrius CBS 109.77]